MARREKLGIPIPNEFNNFSISLNPVAYPILQTGDVVSPSTNKSQRMIKSSTSIPFNQPCNSRFHRPKPFFNFGDVMKFRS